MTGIMDIMDADNLFDVGLNLFNFGQELTHGLMVYLLLPLPFFAMWLLSRKVVIPLVLYTIVGGAFMIIAPIELKAPAMLMFIFGGSGLIYKWFKD